jgi:hypothetical protein
MEFTFSEERSYREFKLPKKSGGYRKITAPNPALLKYQRDHLVALELLWQDVADDYGVEEVQHGFIKNRNCVTAAEKHIGYKTTISMDIEDFFDNVTADHIRLFSAQFGNDRNFYHKDGYCSQGFATSPILCNIALIPAISQVAEYLDATFGDYALTVYADDITISVNCEDYNVLNTAIIAVQQKITPFGFAIKTSKTRIRYAKYGFRRVLGIMVGEESIKVPRKIKYKLRAARHQKNGPSIGGLVTWSKLQLPKAYR